MTPCLAILVEHQHVTDRETDGHRDIAYTALSQCHTIQRHTIQTIRMWADAPRDGRPAEYRWHPLFNAAKFG